MFLSLYLFLPQSSPSLSLCSVSGANFPPCLPCRMLQLSLSWLGLGPVEASPWLLLLLVGASWLLARVLVWTCTSLDNVRRLRGFPQPPKPNWLLGHMGQVSVGSRWVCGIRVTGLQEWSSGGGLESGTAENEGGQGASSFLIHSSDLPSQAFLISFPFTPRLLCGPFPAYSTH